MKVKNLSKVLAFMVAVVMIFAALPIMANADNAADAFVVSYGAPAIPMDVNTKVDLKTLAVEITKGTTVSGADCEWATDVADGIVLDANKKTVEALEKGNYKLTATTAGVTKNVWVIVKAVEETDFYLVNFESLNKDTFNPDDWRGIAAEIGGPIPDISKTVLEDDYIRTPGTNGASYVYIDDIFLDFADYTVTATMSQNSTKNTKIHDYEAYGAGLIGRAHITSDNKYESGIFTSIKQTLGAVLFYPYKVENGITSQRHYGSLIKDSSNNGFKFGQVPAEYAPTGYVWDSINDYHDVKYVFNGQKADMYLEEFYVNELFRVSSFDKNQTQAGYPGFCTYRSYANVKSFAVQLNSNAMPAVMTEEPAPEADITIVGKGTAEVAAVVGAENKYTVTLDPADGYKVKIGSLFINNKPVIDADATGRVYTFTTEDLDNTTITVEYIEDNGQFNTAMLGATVWPEKKGIRFGSRTDSIMRSPENANIGLLNDKIFVNGQNYDIVEIGMIMMPTQLFEGELTIETTNAIIAPVSKIVNITDDFTDIAISLINIPESFNDIEITSVMYIAYNVDGETQYLYTEQIERTYNQVLADASR